MIIFRKDILNNIFFCMVFYFLGSLLVVIFMFWKEDFSFINQSQYTKDVFDVIIIGAGITGVSTAYHLKDSNLKIALFDRDKIGSGVTSRSSAKITYLQGEKYYFTFLGVLEGNDVKDIYALQVSQKALRIYAGGKDNEYILQNDLSFDKEYIFSILLI